MSSSEINLEKLRISGEKIDCAAFYFKTGTVIDLAVRIVGHLSGCVVMLPEMDKLRRWYSDRNGTFKYGFLYSDELKLLSRLHHKNILPFIGYCDEEDVFSQPNVYCEKVILVYEYEFNNRDESLAEYLQNKDKQHHLSWTERLKICIGIAKGLNYLHSGVEGVGRVLHNDLQSKNILLDENLKPKIMGFYHSLIIPANQLHTQVNSYHDHHPDPIYREIGLLDTTTDAYLYGIIMFEMLIRMVANEEKVIGDYKPQRLINIVRRCYDNRPEQLIDPDIRDQIDRRSFQMFKDIAYRCISFYLKDRPTMDEVVKTLTEALDIHNRLAHGRLNLEPQEGFQIPLAEIIMATNNFHGQIETGYTTVNRFYKGHLNDRWRKGPVAVKRCNYELPADEFAIASRLQHENIVQFIGYCDEGNEKILVYECAEMDAFLLISIS